MENINTDCKLNLTDKEIAHTFGSDATLSTCYSCDNMIYEKGMLLCKKLISEGSDE